MMEVWSFCVNNIPTEGMQHDNMSIAPATSLYLIIMPWSCIGRYEIQLTLQLPSLLMESSSGTHWRGEMYPRVSWEIFRMWNKRYLYLIMNILCLKYVFKWFITLNEQLLRLQGQIQINIEQYMVVIYANRMLTNSLLLLYPHINIIQVILGY
jgi:hypothetical protein